MNHEAKDTADDLTKEEKLLAALLSANQELVEVFRVYDEMEKLAFTEMEEKEIAKRSLAETRLDRTVSSDLYCQKNCFLYVAAC